MEEMVRLEMTKAEAELFETTLNQLVQELRASNERMDQMEAERLQLQAETRATINQLKVMLNVETTA